MRGWAGQYYDAIEYYFWGPDKLNASRIPGNSVSADVVVARLRRIEEPLNHLLSIFFDLAPHAFRRAFAQKSVNVELGDNSFGADRSVSQCLGNLNVVQPDLALIGPDGLVAIEVKLGSPSSLNQVLKYALLLSRLGKGKSIGLCYLTQREFRTHWRGLVTPDDVRRAAKQHLSSVDRLGQLGLDASVRHEIAEALSRVSFASWRFHDLALLLNEWVSRPVSSPGDETLQRLCAGLLIELQERGLANVSSQDASADSPRSAAHMGEAVGRDYQAT